MEARLAIILWERLVVGGLSNDFRGITAHRPKTEPAEMCIRLLCLLALLTAVGFWFMQRHRSLQLNAAKPVQIPDELEYRGDFGARHCLYGVKKVNDSIFYAIVVIAPNQSVVLESTVPNLGAHKHVWIETNQSPRLIQLFVSLPPANEDGWLNVSAEGIAYIDGFIVHEGTFAGTHVPVVFDVTERQCRAEPGGTELSPSSLLRHLGLSNGEVSCDLFISNALH